MHIDIAETEEAIKSCYPVIKELRPHLSEDAFITQVKRQIESHDYTLVYIRNSQSVVAAAGFRVTEYLAWGKTFYVDDLITLSSERNQGYASYLMNWLQDKAIELDCNEFHLDSGPQRHEAHRLYKNKQLDITSFHFSNQLKK